MKNEIEQLAQQNDMSIEFVTWFFNEKKANCGNVWFMMMAAMWEGWKGRSIEMDKLAAENVELKAAAILLADEAAQIYRRWNLIQQPDGDIVDMQTIHELLCACHELPATDRIVAGIKADGVEEWVSSRVGRWNGTTEEALKYAAQLRKGASE